MLRRLRKFTAASRGKALNGQPFPFACSDSPIDGKLLPFFWDWIATGTDGIDDLRDTANHPRRTAASCVEQAANTDNPGILSELARRPWPYVRATVTVHPDVPESAVWGDGIVDLGLAQDSDPWVRGMTLLHSPIPPSGLVKAIEEQLQNAAEEAKLQVG